MFAGIETPRLRLSLWLDSHRDDFAAMHADPEVMADYGQGTFDREQSDLKFDRYAEAFDRNGYGRWAIEAPDGRFVGYCGVMPSRETHPLGPHHEIGWRMVRSAWGHGYATEAARAALDDVFGRMGLTQVLAYTAPENVRSQAVMARLSLRREPGLDFTTEQPWTGWVWIARP